MKIHSSVATSGTLTAREGIIVHNAIAIIRQRELDLQKEAEQAKAQKHLVRLTKFPASSDIMHLRKVLGNLVTDTFTSLK